VDRQLGPQAAEVAREVARPLPQLAAPALGGVLRRLRGILGEHRRLLEVGQALERRRDAAAGLPSARAGRTAAATWRVARPSDNLCGMSDEQVARITRLLRQAIKVSDFNSRDVERRLGFSGGYLSRLFGGQIEIKINHILDVLDVIGLYPHEFFQMAFPERAEKPSPVLQRLQEMTQGIQPVAVPPRPAEPPAASPPPAVDMDRVQELMAEALRRAFADLAKPPKS
jgi:hypothetical protein